MPKVKPIKKNKNRNNKKNKSSVKADKNMTITVVPSAVTNKVAAVPKNFVGKSNDKLTLCSITDPFCDHARGAKWPDGNSFATVPFQNRAHIVMNTLANAGNVFYFTPIAAPFNALPGVGFGAGVYTMGATFSSSTGLINLSSTFSGFRVVSGGLILRNLMTVQTTSGYLIVSRLSIMPILGSTVSPGVMLNPQVTTYPIVPGMEVPVLFKPLGADSRNFVPFLTTNNVNLIDPAWDIIKVEIVGAVASGTAVIDVELFYNYEMQLNADSILASTFQKANPMSLKMTQASNRLTDAVVNIANKSVDSLSDAIERRASKFLADAFMG